MFFNSFPTLPSGWNPHRCCQHSNACQSSGLCRVHIVSVNWNGRHQGHHHGNPFCAWRLTRGHREIIPGTEVPASLWTMMVVHVNFCGSSSNSRFRFSSTLRLYASLAAATMPKLDFNTFVANKFFRQAISNVTCWRISSLRPIPIWVTRQTSILYISSCPCIVPQPFHMACDGVHRNFK